MRKVTFAYPYTVAGKDYRTDQTAEFDEGTAVDLINDGFARDADKTDNKAADAAKKG